MSKTLGQIGYERWRDLIEPGVRQGLATWSQLQPSSREGWEDIADTIVLAADGQRVQGEDVKGMMGG